MAHEKLVSRVTSKDYLSSLKANIYGQLTDVGFFYNKFQEETLKTDVLPWLYNETEAYLDELNSAEQLPNQLIDGYVDEMAETHKSTIAAHNQKRDDAIQAAKEEEEAKKEAKLQRRLAREAERKAEELAKLREKIQEEFINQGKTEEGILF